MRATMAVGKHGSRETQQGTLQDCGQCQKTGRLPCYCRHRSMLLAVDLPVKSNQQIKSTAFCAWICCRYVETDHLVWHRLPRIGLCAAINSEKFQAAVAFRFAWISQSLSWNLVFGLIRIRVARWLLTCINVFTNGQCWWCIDVMFCPRCRQVLTENPDLQLLKSGCGEASPWLAELSVI